MENRVPARCRDRAGGAVHAHADAGDHRVRAGARRGRDRTAPDRSGGPASPPRDADRVRVDRVRRDRGIHDDHLATELPADDDPRQRHRCAGRFGPRQCRDDRPVPGRGPRRRPHRPASRDDDRGGRARAARLPAVRACRGTVVRADRARDGRADGARDLLPRRLLGDDLGAVSDRDPLQRRVRQL
jgi:hypothetical protein